MPGMSFHSGRLPQLAHPDSEPPEVPALFYSLFESAKIAGVEPKSYALHAAHAAIAEPGAVTLPSSLLSS